MKATLKACAVLGLIALIAVSATGKKTTIKSKAALTRTNIYSGNIYIWISIFNIGLNTGRKSSVSKKPGVCPPPKTLMGSCEFNAEVNCLSDTSCSGKTKCCREGCNKICKDPLKDLQLPDFGIWKKWRDEKMKDWNHWADETKQVLMYVQLSQRCIKILGFQYCYKIFHKLRDAHSRLVEEPTTPNPNYLLSTSELN